MEKPLLISPSLLGLNVIKLFSPGLMLHFPIMLSRTLSKTRMQEMRGSLWSIDMAPSLALMLLSSKSISTCEEGLVSMQEYLHQLKVITNQLATCGASVNEDDLILYTLSGLPYAYRPFQTYILTRS